MVYMQQYIYSKCDVGMFTQWHVNVYFCYFYMNIIYIAQWLFGGNSEILGYSDFFACRQKLFKSESFYKQTPVNIILPQKYDIISQLRHSYAKGPFCVVWNKCFTVLEDWFVKMFATIILWTCCGWLYFCGNQFSWVPIFVDWTKIPQKRGSKFIAIIDFFIIHTEKYYFVGIGIRGFDPPRKSTKIGISGKLSHWQ